MSNLLENDDIGEVSLICMEDVQPQEKNNSIAISLDSSEVLYDYIFYDIDDNEVANVGSMVAIKCEQVESENVYEQHPVALPDVPDPKVVVPTINESQKEPNPNSPSKKWPQLEIMPGGVIKSANTFESPTKSEVMQKKTIDPDNMMFECAKCSQQFEYLSLLVEHVKWHNYVNKRPNELKNERSKTVCLDHDYIFLRTRKGLIFQKSQKSTENRKS